MTVCQHCKGYLVTVESYEHGVRFHDHRCLMCGRYYPIQMVTAQVEGIMVKDTLSIDRPYTHTCKNCGVQYQHKWQTRTYYCSRKCNYTSQAKMAGEIKRGRRVEA